MFKLIAWSLGGSSGCQPASSCFKSPTIARLSGLTLWHVLPEAGPWRENLFTIILKYQVTPQRRRCSTRHSCGSSTQTDACLLQTQFTWYVHKCNVNVSPAYLPGRCICTIASKATCHPKNTGIVVSHTVRLPAQSTAVNEA
jgi:hypothetical protein